jgi:hypothetical protein
MKMNKYGFIIGIVIGIVLAIAIMNPQMLYRECSDLFDYYSRDDIMTIVLDKILAPAGNLLFEGWQWKPFKSQPANIAIGALHVIAIGIIFPVVMIASMLYALFFLISFFTGTVLGAVAGALVTPFVYLFYSQRHIPGPELPNFISSIYIGSGVLFVYITHALLAGILFGWLSSFLERHEELEAYPEGGYFGSPVGKKDYSSGSVKRTGTDQVEELLQHPYRLGAVYSRLNDIDITGELERAERDLEALRNRHHKEMADYQHERERHELDYMIRKAERDIERLKLIKTIHNNIL